MVTEPLPDWMQKALLVGTYNDLPILIQVDASGVLSGGLGAYTDRYAQTNAVASTGIPFNVDTDVVPAGEKWILTNIAVSHNDTVPRRVWVRLRASDVNILLFRNSFLLKDEVIDRQGMWVLKEGDYIRVIFELLASGKTGTVRVAGYKVEDLT